MINELNLKDSTFGVHIVMSKPIEKIMTSGHDAKLTKYCEPGFRLFLFLLLLLLLFLILLSILIFTVIEFF